MANPQKEDGFTAIANEIMEALYKADLSGQEFRLTLLILRKTYGFHKSEDSISLSQMCAETGIHHIRCSQLIKRLGLMKILTVSENINGHTKKYKFNKDFDKWDTVSENINPCRKMKSTLNVLCKKPLQKNASTKEIYKRNITKEKAPEFLYPDWLPKEAFSAFVEMRKNIKKPLTTHAIPLAISKLEKLRKSGNDPTEVLNQSTLNSWQGLFEIRKENNNGFRGKRDDDGGYRIPVYQGDDAPEISDTERKRNLERLKSLASGKGKNPFS